MTPPHTSAEETRTCPYCHTVFYYEKGPGRPPIYCTDTCRKYAAAHRKYAQETNTPVRLMHASPVEITPEPAPVIRYIKPSKEQMKDYLRSDPANVIPHLLKELGFCLNDRKIPRAERAEIAQTLGRVLVQLAQAEYGPVNGESASVPIETAMSPQDFVHLSQVLGSFEQIAAWVQSNREYTEYEQMVAVGRQVRKARKEIAGEMEDLRRQVLELEGKICEQEEQLERSYAAVARWEQKYVQARARSLEVAPGGRCSLERVAELEALVGKWQRRAAEWEQVAKMERARCVEEVARVRAEVLGGGSAFFRGR